MKLFFFYFLIIYLAPDQLISREDTTHYTTHKLFYSFNFELFHMLLSISFSLFNSK
jgi:hypothetical protein